MRHSTPSSSLDKATQAVQKLEASYQRARKRCRTLEDQIRVARRTLQRERVKALVGRQVKHGTWLHSSDRYAWLNNEIGTLLKVNQKYGVVDYGARGLMNIPFSDIQSAEDPVTAITLDAMMGDKAVSDKWFDSASKREPK